MGAGQVASGPATTGAKRDKGSKVYLAVDTLGHLLALQALLANKPDHAHSGQLVAKVQAATN